MRLTKLLLLLVLATASSACAEDWTTTKSVCHDGLSTPPSMPSQPEPGWRFHTLEECAVDLFTLTPVGPTMGNVGTGSGFGGGIHAVYAPNANNQFTIKGLYSLNSSYVVSGQYQILFRPIRPIEIKGPHGRPGQIDDTKGDVEFTLERFDLRAQDFYGLGPSTTLAGHAVYRQQETWTGVDGYMPIPVVSGRPGIVGVLGELKYLRPVTKGVTGDSFPSVNILYGEAGAPASTLQPDFIQLGVGFSFRTPTTKPLLWEQHQAQIIYRHYSELGSNQFSFDRLEASGDVSFDLLVKPKGNGRWSSVDYNRPWWKDTLCMQRAVGGCSAGTLKLTGLVTTSYTGTGSSVPFYLQPTLGGADFDGIDTLRGLVDYRLRDPNRLLMQADFDKAIAQIGLKNHPLGEYGLYTFFDAGNVANTPGQLTANGLRTDVGVGFSLQCKTRLLCVLT